VDEVRWLSLEDAAQLLTYPRDRELLIAFSGQVASCDESRGCSPRPTWGK